tara:strand:+ start:149 stop:1177 length:1029 start_codon:yes stop_codon:yes gene_type:complete
MKLFQHKYIPIKKDDFYFNQDKLEIIDKYLEHFDLPNCIFYGPYGSGKMVIAKYLINQYFNNDNLVYSSKKIIYNLKEEEIDLQKSIHHYEVDCNNFNLNDKKFIVEFISEISKTNNINNNKIKIIIIKNAENLSYNTQIIISKLIENFSTTSRFIFISHSLTKLISKLKTHCLLINIKKPSNNNVYLLLNHIALNEKINLECVEEITSKCNLNINSAIFMLQQYQFTQEIVNNFNYQTYIKQFINIIMIYKEENIDKLREEIYNLLIYDINIYNLLEIFLIHIYNQKDLNDDNKFKILTAITNYSYIINKGYRQIYHYELLFYTIINILKHNNITLLNDLL